MRTKVTLERANSIECYIHIWLKMFYEYGPTSGVVELGLNQLIFCFPFTDQYCLDGSWYGILIYLMNNEKFKWKFKINIADIFVSVWF